MSVGRRRRLAVVGGGITGLAAAWEARHDAEVTVVEPGHLGGRLRTDPFGDRAIDSGADAFLTRVPHAVALADELGLRADLVAPAAGRALLWTDRGLRPLPDGLVLGVPRDLRPVARSGLLGPLGLARAAADLVLPATDWPTDVSVGDLVARRFGRRVADRLVDPLVGSIHAGRIDELGAAATTPQLLAAARSSRSLLLALRRSAAGAPSGPIFLAPRAGMAELTDRLVARLRAGGTRFVAATADAVRREPAGGLRLSWSSGPGPAASEAFDGVVLAGSAAATARILGSAAPPWLSSVRTASVALVTLELDAGAPFAPAGCSGILVPRERRTLMTACSFASTKWPHWAEGGRLLLRVSCGRAGDERFRDLDDGPLVDRLVGELGQVLGDVGRPVEARVSRWPDAFAQYGVGHLASVAATEAAIAESLPGVRIAGASYHGAGIPACVASGRRAAAALTRSGVGSGSSSSPANSAVETPSP